MLVFGLAMAPDSSRKRLPFEPTSKGKGSGKSPSHPKPDSPATPARPAQAADPNPVSPVAAAKAEAIRAKAKATPSKSVKTSPQGSATGIPEVVSQRMLRRLLVFSGMPTCLGVLIFFASYFLIVKGGVELPAYAVLLTTLGCFGLGVVGLTYGVLSASWDEDRPGDWLGLEEFKLNLGRMTSAWGSKSQG